MKKDMSAMIGSWAFLIGVILAVVLGFSDSSSGGSSAWTLVLVIIGLVVGFLNITNSEATPFLMSGTALVAVSYFGSDVISASADWPWLGGILNSLLAIFVPATIVVAIKNVFSMARS